MNLINNRYKIFKQIDESAIVPRYLVKDLSESEEKEISVIDKEYISDSLLDFYTDKYPIYKNLISPMLAKSLDFGIIKRIDDKQARALQYYILSEHFETIGYLQEISRELSKTDALSLFVQACRAIYYLHTKDIFYKELNYDTIMVGKINGEYSLKLKDIALTELYKRNRRSINCNPLYFKSPEVIYEGNISKQADIYSLGVFLFCLVSKCSHDGKHFKTDFYNFKNEAHDEFSLKALPIIERMTIKSEYSNLIDVIMDINETFWTDHKAFEVSDIQHLVFDTRLVGRDREMRMIIDNFERMSSGTEPKRYVCVHGEFGIGKTLFLKTLSSKLYSKNLDVYSVFRSESSGILGSIINQLSLDYPELEMRSYDFSSMNGVIKYIYDCIKDKPTIFIIDNFEMADSYSVDALEKLMDINKKLMIVFSYKNGYRSNRLSELTAKESKNGALLDIELSLLSNNDSALLIKQVIGHPELSDGLANSMYPFTNGNPLFIEETLKHLYFNSVLYVDEDDGLWHTTNDRDIDVAMPQSIHHAVAEQAAKLEKASYETLEAVSIFNIEVSSTEICTLLDIDENTVAIILDKLAHDGILLEITVKKPRYIFSNQILKNYIYEKLDNKLEMHKRAADALRKMADLPDKILDEIMYQLEKSGQEELLLEYSLKSADKNRMTINIERVIKNLSKALEISRRYGMREQEFNVILNLSYLYRNNGKHSKAIEYMKLAEQLSDSSERNGIIVINELCSNYLMVGDVERAAQYVEKAALIFCDLKIRENYFDLYIAHLYKEMLILCHNSEYEETIEAATRALELCPSNNYEYKGRFYTMRGHACMYTGLHDESLRNYLEAGRFFEKTEDIQEYIITVLNIAMLYKNCFDDGDMAMIMLKEVIDLCSKKRIFEPQARAYTGIANIHFSNMNYVDALGNYNESLKISDFIGESQSSFSCKCNMSALYINIDEYEKAYSGLKECEELAKGASLDRLEMINLWYLGSLFFLTMGRVDRASEYLHEIRPYSSEKIFIPERELNILKEYINAELSPDDTLLQVFKVVKSYITGTGSIINELNTICDFLIYINDRGCLLNNGFIEDLRSITTIDEETIPSSTPPYLKAKLLFLKSILVKKEEKAKHLMKAYELAKENGQNLFWVKVCIELSNCFINSYIAVSYAAEACELIQALLSGVPDQFKESYVARHRLLRPFKMILSDSSISNLSPLKIIYHDNLFADIIDNREFNEDEKENYYSKLPTDIKSADDVVKKLGTNPEKNLDLIVKYLAASTYASWCAIISEFSDGEFSVVASSDGNMKLDINVNIFKKTRVVGDNIFITENYKNYKIQKEKMSTANIKAFMSLPIRFEPDVQISGYLYLHSNSIFHNFSQSTFEECMWFTSLIKINLELYRIRLISSIDKLTGALNRKFLETALDHCIEKAAGTDAVFSLIMIDFDKFKGINDNYGHQTGDEVLGAAGKIIKSNLRKETIFGRYGGEEFVVILDGAGSKHALKVAEKLKNAIGNAKLMGTRRSVTASMGISTYNEHCTTKVGLLEKADKALYMCKVDGGNKCIVWDDGIDAAARSTGIFSGISTGDTRLDERRMRIVLDMIELIESDMPMSERVERYLGKLSEITGADLVCLTAERTNKRCADGTYEFNAINNGEVVGVISVKMPEQKRLTLDDMDFVDNLCNIIADSLCRLNKLET